MKIADSINLFGSEAVFDSQLLWAGDVNAKEVARQLSRWLKSGHIIQLRRGLYALAPKWGQPQPHPFLVSNRMAPGSYVSCQSALSFYGLIPEFVPVTIAVGSVRPQRKQTALGVYQFHHLQPDLIFGYHQIDLPHNQQAHIALPEKALLDLIYLTPGADSDAWLFELRLEPAAYPLNSERLHEFALRSKSPKLQRAAGLVVKFLGDQDKFREI